jgi:phage gp29-like protein
MDNPSKFLVAKFKSKSGSYLGAGFMRVLTPMWIMIVYGRDFLMNFAQKYGNPFFDISYEASLQSNQAEVDKFERLARMAANQGYFVHPDTSKLEIGKEHGVTGDNAQTAMMRIADEQCQYMMLGQTLTSSAPTNGGTRAQGEVHENVRQERLEEHAKWIARILTEQFSESLLLENYGKSYLRNRERPTVEPDMTRPMTAGEQATFLKDISQSTVAILTDEAYKRAGLTKPSPGDEVLVRGEHVILEEAVTATEKRAKEFDEQVEQQMTINSLQAPPDDPNNLNGNVPTADSIQAVLREADAKDVEEFSFLVQAAERSEHQNGEVLAVRTKFKQILDKRRL